MILLFILLFIEKRKGTETCYNVQSYNVALKYIAQYTIAVQYYCNYNSIVIANTLGL